MKVAMFEDAEAILMTYNGANNRYRSWSLFYHFFNDGHQDRRYDSVHLVAYLASWGMYRGSSRLLQFHDYTVHDGALEIVREKQFVALKAATLAIYNHEANVRLLTDLIVRLRTHYRNNDVTPTDTLISKILLGCLACVPAFDRNFILGVRSVVTEHINAQALALPLYSLNAFAALRGHLQGFPAIDLTCHQGWGYPFFKQVDMFFFQKGSNVAAIQV